MPTLSIERTLSALRDDVQLMFQAKDHYEKAQVDHHAALRAAASRFLRPDADKAPTHADIECCIEKHRNALLDQLPPAEVEAAEHEQRMVEALKSAIIEHGNRVIEYADGQGIDAGLLREFLKDQAVRHKLPLSALLDSISDHIRNDPDTVLSTALQIALCNVDQLRTLAQGAIGEGTNLEEAKKSYEQLLGQLEVMRSTPRLEEWTHLEAWRFFDGFSRILRQITGRKDMWSTFWGRLREELVRQKPAPDFDHLREEAKSNLARLRGDASTLPPIPTLPEQATPGLDPEYQAILEKARAQQNQTAAAQRTWNEVNARWRRAYEAWGRVSQFKGDAIPMELTGEALHHRYAEFIVALGRVLKDDGWQDCIHAVKADTEPKTVALGVLRKAMEGDTATVARMLQAGIFDGRIPLQFGLRADEWLREGLKREVLDIQPAPHAPAGWEGLYLEAVETVEDFVKWFDREFQLQDVFAFERADGPSDGRRVRNDFRLVLKLEMKGKLPPQRIPPEPRGPFTRQDELTVLRTLRRLCVELQPDADHSGGQTGGKERRVKKKRQGGRRPLEQSDPLKLHIYQPIQQEHQLAEDYVGTVERLKGDKDFVEQLQQAHQKLNTKLVRVAIAFFGQRKREQARKQQETGQS
jgi:hypothetical protein